MADPLSDADATIQPNPDASPAKWHLAHTTWFFETFVLRDHVRGYCLFDDRYPYLFNSYYEGEGERHPRPRRGMISRPSLDEVRGWRHHVDEALEKALPDLPEPALKLVELGIQHEQQHQELLLTDILASFAESPLEPAYGQLPPVACRATEPLAWLAGREGIVEIGAGGSGFAFDSERPHHHELLHPHALAQRPVTNGEWQQFIADGGYREPRLWLSEGWDWVQRENIARPLYWHEEGSAFTLGGRREIDRAAPVAHVSYFEADAFANWAGARLPGEAEWESAAAGADPHLGHQLDDAGAVIPQPGGALFGDVWQWTRSAFLPYPGFHPAEGTVGEYNGKFMCGQFVLKGASCATPRGHSRASYRNFFPPSARWQFSGVRLARDN
ncbi:ergothioneine biosynthesis protein EgtB [Sphingomonas sp. GCM10030256]|uniref:ergothioneine biosynthesis protein EgtB n=1 Tax=Sphingomonas sp. GCM10030256 TaxID=3273427 RepID=UPI00361E0E95